MTESLFKTSDCKLWNNSRRQLTDKARWVDRKEKLTKTMATDRGDRAAERMERWRKGAERSEGRH